VSDGTFRPLSVAGNETSARKRAVAKQTALPRLDSRVLDAVINVRDVVPFSWAECGDGRRRHSTQSCVVQKKTRSHEHGRAVKWDDWREGVDIGELPITESTSAVRGPIAQYSTCSGSGLEPVEDERENRQGLTLPPIRVYSSEPLARPRAEAVRDAAPR